MADFSDKRRPDSEVIRGMREKVTWMLTWRDERRWGWMSGDRDWKKAKASLLSGPGFKGLKD